MVRSASNLSVVQPPDDTPRTTQLLAERWATLFSTIQRRKARGEALKFTGAFIAAGAWITFVLLAKGTTDFQASDLANALSLRHEMRRVLSFLPFINTTGGSRSNCCVARASSVGSVRPASCEDGPASGAVSTATDDGERPAASHAAGFVIPAFNSAAATFSCCVICMDDAGVVAGEI